MGSQNSVCYFPTRWQFEIIDMDQFVVSITTRTETTTTATAATATTPKSYDFFVLWFTDFRGVRLCCCCCCCCCRRRRCCWRGNAKSWNFNNSHWFPYFPFSLQVFRLTHLSANFKVFNNNNQALFSATLVNQTTINYIKCLVCFSFDPVCVTQRCN